jgi:hypothetical protein
VIAKIVNILSRATAPVVILAGLAAAVVVPLGAVWVAVTIWRSL